MFNRTKMFMSVYVRHICFHVFKICSLEMITLMLQNVSPFTYTTEDIIIPFFFLYFSTIEELILSFKKYRSKDFSAVFV